jgi:hypothetical protein
MPASSFTTTSLRPKRSVSRSSGPLIAMQPPGDLIATEFDPYDYGHC